MEGNVRRGSHVTITHDPFDITVQAPASGPSPGHVTLLDLGPPSPLLVTSGCHHWRPVEASSLRDAPPHWNWHLVAIKTCTVGTSRQYASYWNAFLYYWYFSDVCWFLGKSICHICQWNHYNTGCKTQDPIANVTLWITNTTIYVHHEFTRRIHRVIWHVWAKRLRLSLIKI